MVVSINLGTYAKPGVADLLVSPMAAQQRRPTVAGNQQKTRPPCGGLVASFCLKV